MSDSSFAPTDPQGNPMTQDCQGRELFNHVTSRWALLVLVSLFAGRRRFHVLRDGIEGISEKMLSQTLKTLARDGLLQRDVEHTVPPQVSYQLTALGQSLTEELRGLIGWIGAHIGPVLQAQRAHDAALASPPKPTRPGTLRHGEAIRDNASLWPARNPT